MEKDEIHEFRVEVTVNDDDVTASPEEVTQQTSFITSPNEENNLEKNGWVAGSVRIEKL